MNEVMREIKGFRIHYGFTAGTTASNDMVCYEESVGRKAKYSACEETEGGPKQTHNGLVLTLNLLTWRIW